MRLTLGSTYMLGFGFFIHFIFDKEGEIEKELVQQVNIEMLQGQMKLHAKVIVATWQQFVIARASISAVGTCTGMVLFKFVISEDYQATL